MVHVPIANNANNTDTYHMQVAQMIHSQKHNNVALADKLQINNVVSL